MWRDVPMLLQGVRCPAESYLPPELLNGFMSHIAGLRVALGDNPNVARLGMEFLDGVTGLCEFQMSVGNNLYCPELVALCGVAWVKDHGDGDGRGVIIVHLDRLSWIFRANTRNMERYLNSAGCEIIKSEDEADYGEVAFLRGVVDRIPDDGGQFRRGFRVRRWPFRDPTYAARVSEQARVLARIRWDAEERARKNRAEAYARRRDTLLETSALKRQKVADEEALRKAAQDFADRVRADDAAAAMAELNEEMPEHVPKPERVSYGPLQLRAESYGNASRQPGARTWSQDAIESSQVLLHLSGEVAYEAVREVFALPSPDTIRLRTARPKAELGARMLCKEFTKEDAFATLMAYRESHGIPAEVTIVAAVGVDSAAATDHGNPPRGNPNKTGYVTIANLQPLHKPFPTEVVSISTSDNGNIDRDLWVKRIGLFREVAAGANFVIPFMATDGATTMVYLHKKQWKLYKNTSVSVKLRDLVSGALQPCVDGSGPDVWLMTDGNHVKKGCRTHLMERHTALAWDANSISTSAEKIQDILKLPGAALTDFSKSARISDDSATQLFDITNWLLVYGAGDFAAALFMLPCVLSNIVDREPSLTLETRLDIVERLFEFFFGLAKSYPKTGKDTGIYEQGSACLKTMFRRETCIAWCNMLIGQAAILLFWPTRFAVERGGSICCEYVFGMARLRASGDTRLGRFISIIKNAILVNRWRKAHGFRKLLRFRTSGGCTLLENAPTGDGPLTLPDGEELGALGPMPENAITHLIDLNRRRDDGTVGEPAGPEAGLVRWMYRLPQGLQACGGLRRRRRGVSPMKGVACLNRLMMEIQQPPGVVPVLPNLEELLEKF
jgi:hypothetical protein